MIKDKIYSLTNGEETIVFDNKQYTINEIDFGNIPIVLNTTKGYLQEGERLISRVVSCRDINIVGYIVQSPSLIYKRKLQRIISGDYFRIIVHDLVFDKKYYIDATADGSVTYGIEKYLNCDELVKFNISATATTPYFYDEVKTNLSISAWQNKFHFPVNCTLDNQVVFAEKERRNGIKIHNEGDVAIGVIIHLQAIGDVTNPIIFGINDEKMKLYLDMKNGDEIVVNTKYGEKGVWLNGESIMDALDYASVFPQFPVGDSEIVFDADWNLANLNIWLDYRASYVEV